MRAFLYFCALAALALASCGKSTPAAAPQGEVRSAASATPWEQFRGPTGQGIVATERLPLNWSEKKNVKWKTPLPGEGWSSPVAADGRIWMTTATEDGHSLRALCVDAESGKLLHDVEVFHVEQLLPKHELNSFASPTPIIAQGRVYVHFGANGTACLDASSAKVLWTNQELKIDHENGPGGSFALWKDRLLIPCDGRDQQFEAALECETGKLLWKTKRSAVFTRPPDMRKAYATPLLVEIDGRTESITAAADRMYGYDPATGEELWFVRYQGFSNVARPITGLGMLFVCTGFRNSDMLAIRMGGNSGDCTESHVVWKRTVSVPFQSSPVLVGERIYAVTDSGIGTCVNAMTGEEVWKQRIGGEFSASPITDGKKVYFFDRKGKATVIEAGDEYKQLEQNKLEDGFMASPAVIGDSLILRTKAAIYRIEALATPK